MPFLITETTKAVVTATLISTSPVEEVCFDKTPRLFGFQIGKEIVTCYKNNPEIHPVKEIRPVVIYEPIHPALSSGNIIYHQ